MRGLIQLVQKSRLQQFSPKPVPTRSLVQPFQPKPTRAHFLSTSQFALASRIRMSLPKVIFVLGGPGAGKGTQCARIVEKFGYVHLSAGDLLRAERAAPGSQFGELIEHHITNGTIVPVEITCSLLERAMTESGKENFLIDGFPRNEDNLQGWNKQMGEKVDLKGVLFFHCSQDICTQRCLARGAAGSGRTDDNEESLRKRFVTYEQATMPIIKHFEEKNLVHQLDAAKTPDEVFGEVEKILSNIQG